ncbi:MAG: phosphomethylpyrimidine synthase ThiC, partial [Nitrospirota bacterium]
MTMIEDARAGRITDDMMLVAKEEGFPAGKIAEGIGSGKVIITKNRLHKGIKPLGIGTGMRTKVNANIGTSSDHQSIEEEIEKLSVATEAGADAVMDLSTGGDLREIRRRILFSSLIPVGTVPIYQAAVTAVERHGFIGKMKEDEIFDAIEADGEIGVDFVTVHCGVTLGTLERLKKEGRILDVVSRGGAFLFEWMIYNEKENPLYERFDRLLEIAKRYDMTLSLGDGLRPGCLADATDRAQIQELIILGELTERAWKEGVQVMIEGPGHMPINQIEMNVRIQKELCKGAPFYVLGPLVTDIAPGYDHIVSAIGGAVAGAAGADFLCYVTPAEHLRLPTIEDVREGV